MTTKVGTVTETLESIANEFKKLSERIFGYQPASPDSHRRNFLSMERGVDGVLVYAPIQSCHEFLYGYESWLFGCHFFSSFCHIICRCDAP